ncbi:MAG: aminodeoxychorismate synthase component I [Sphingomonadales bacterium]|nr:aminodeoxychorismate synthase component I [Sphingomonadales bacterium]MDE2168733.1 aminodeoxychorismate synthase component I [Sphingomonadales bacterium]
MPALPTSFDRHGPFVLLDDATAGHGGKARLYTAPREIIMARSADEVAPAFTRMAQCHGGGAALAGFIAYEAGLALEPRLASGTRRRAGGEGPLLWMGVFEGWHSLDATDVPAFLAAHGREGCHSLGPLSPQFSPGTYAQGFKRLKQAIAQGDIYQANYTFPLSGPWQGDPLALYAALRGKGGGAHGALVFDGSSFLLSLSPELFFTCDGGAITARPMKGTRPRGPTPEADAALRADLLTSPKDRAENLMILDLMRNDIARVAVPGSVRVPHPFAIETYPSVHQMVSGIEAQLAPEQTAIDLLRALFPCGSVTGAPKIRAMELIEAVEPAPRGPYCGAIGHIDPPGQGQITGRAAFNVAIRTLRLTGSGTARPAMADQGRAVLGVGSAVVADSTLWNEWRECLVKGGFVHQPPNLVAQVDLFETMRFTPDEGMALLEFHLERMKESAATLGFSFDRHGARNAIHALCFELEAPSRIRLSLARSGAISVEAAPLPPKLDEAGPVPCVILPLPVDPSDWRLAHKTSDRWFYEAGLRAAREHHAKEALFLRDDGLLTEGCFTNIFVERDGMLLTPPTALGLLPGVLRRSLIEEGRAREAEMTVDDLAEGFLIGNGLRGLMRARLMD